MLLSQGCPESQFWRILLKYFFFIVAGCYKNKVSEWFFKMKDIFIIMLHLLCVSINSSDFALTGLKENIVVNSEDNSISWLLITFFFLFT